MPPAQPIRNEKDTVLYLRRFGFNVQPGQDKRIKLAQRILQLYRDSPDLGFYIQKFNKMAWPKPKFDEMKGLISRPAPLAPERIETFVRGSKNKKKKQEAPVQSISDIMEQISGLMPAPGGPPSIDMSGLKKIAKSKSPFRGLKPPKIRKKDILALIQSQYDPVFQAIQTAMSKTQAQGQQNIADLTGWYDQVLNAQNQATQLDAAAAAAAMQSFNEGVEGFIESVGGGANPAAGDIAKAAAAAAAGITAIGEAQGNFDRNMTPLLMQAAAEAKTAQQNLTSQRVADLTLELAGLKKEQGSKILEMLMNAKQQNFENLLQLAQLKAGWRQQKFGNLLDIANMEAQLASMVPESPDPLDMLSLAYDIQGKQLSNAQLLKELTQGPTPEKPDKLSISERRSVADTIMNSVLVPGTSQLRMPPKQAVQRVIDVIRTLGLDPFRGEGRQLRLLLLKQLRPIITQNYPHWDIGPFGNAMWVNNP